MCLGQELTKLGQKRIISKAKKQGYIRAWKTVELRLGTKHFWCDYTRECYKKGIYEAEGLDRIGGGWHAFRDKKSAEKWKGGRETIIECLALPEWIKNIGVTWDKKKTILFTKLCFPEFPKRKITVKEFKRLCEAVK